MSDHLPVEPPFFDLPDPRLANDAEVSLLGAAMSGYPDVDELLALVEPSDFYHPNHEAIWAAIARVHRAGNPPDPISVRVAVGTLPGFDPIRLLEVTTQCPIVAQAPFYATEVASASGVRRLQTASVKIRQITADDDTLENKRERCRAVIDAAARGRDTSQARTLAAALPAVLDLAEHGQTNSLSSPWPDIDRLIGGLAPGRLIVVGARPGVGKSLMGTNLALHVARRHQHAVLVASLEMPELEVAQRMVAAVASVNLTRLQGGHTSEQEWQQISDHYAALDELPITINDAPDQSIAAIAKAARDIQRTRDDLALIVVDYLQLVRPTERRGNRAEEVGEISRQLKILARESGACVVAMAQVNRQSTHRTDTRPTMADLRESGSIEADADQVILLHPVEDTPELEVIVDKNRHGPRGLARLMASGHYAQLHSITWTPGGSA